ncbi:MAG: hypothetical protein AB7V50_05905, partial [Vampirovibrionia bacterium]
MNFNVNTLPTNAYSQTNGFNNNPFAHFEEKVNFQPAIIPDTKPDIVVINEKKVITEANNGKFDTKVAVKNFFKGLISPISSMFNSYKSLAIGMLTIAGGAALCSIGFAPAFVAIGAVIGGLQALTTAIQFSKAKNGDDVEKAFYSAGISTSTIGLSIFGAKGALNSVGQNTNNISRSKAVLECFKKTPESFNNLFGT